MLDLLKSKRCYTMKLPLNLDVVCQHVPGEYLWNWVLSLLGRGERGGWKIMLHK